jgi:hypothetical protein
VENLRAGALTIEVARTDGRLELRWQGKSNDRNPDKLLAPFFASAFEEAAKDKLRLDLHFEMLQHFNSSTIGYVIQVIQEARERQQPMTLLFDGAQMWQKLSFEALIVFKHGNPYLDVKAA